MHRYKSVTSLGFVEVGVLGLVSTGTWPTTPYRSVLYFHVAKLKR